MDLSKAQQSKRNWYVAHRNMPEFQVQQAARTIKWRQHNLEKLILSRAKYRAKKAGLEFNLELSDIVIPEKCPLLGVTLGNKYLNPAIPADYCPSLDRKDNTKGYIKDNIWIISFKANRMKNTANANELQTFAKAILRFYEDLD